MSIDWQPFVKLVAEHDSFVLTSHMRADCDAIGSERGMAGALRSLGKQVRIVNGDAVPPHIAFIDPAGEVNVLGEDIGPDDVTADVLIVLDTSAWGQLGPMGDVLKNFSGQKVVIDHHVSEDDFGAVVFKDTKSEATGRLVLEASEALGADLTADMATSLFAAIATDTGWFRFASVDEKTYAAAAKLVAAGAEPSAIFSILYEQNSIARLKLQGRIISKTVSAVDGRLMYSPVTLADLADTGAEPTDTEDVVNRLLSVKGVEVAILFLELKSGATKVSLRSRSAVDVRAIAEIFGGGGHTAAAGVRFEGPLDDAISAVLDAVRTALG